MSEWNDIILFNKTNKVRSSEKSITLYLTTAKTVNMSFNSCIARNITEDYINLAFSRSRNAIIIFLSPNKDNNSYKLSKKPGKGCTISIQQFLNSFNLDKNLVLGSFTPIEDLIDDKLCWILYLDQPISKPKS
jgi:hypothetical protein